MDADNIVSIKADGKLELPPKIQSQIKPGDRTPFRFANATKFQ